MEERKFIMKKVLVTLLGILVVLGVLAGAGFVGYRMGYNQAARVVVNKTAQLPPQDRNQTLPDMPMLRNFERGFGMRGMPMHNFGDGFHRGFGPGGMMNRGHGFGFFGPIQFLVRIAVFALIIWVIYKLFKGSGWTLIRQPTQVTKTETEVVEPKTE